MGPPARLTGCYTDPMAPEQTNPNSWRDVYQLVRDSRADVLDAVGEQSDRIDILTIKFNAHEVNHATEAALAVGRLQERTSIFGIARSTVALAVSLVGTAVAIVAVALK